MYTVRHIRCEKRKSSSVGILYHMHVVLCNPLKYIISYSHIAPNASKTILLNTINFQKTKQIKF